MTEYDLKNISKKITLDEIKQLIMYCIDYQEKWNNLEINRFFLTDSGYESYLHEIIGIDTKDKIITAIDHSQTTRPVVKINYLPSETYTWEEFENKYRK